MSAWRESVAAIAKKITSLAVPKLDTETYQHLLQRITEADGLYQSLKNEFSTLLPLKIGTAEYLLDEYLPSLASHVHDEPATYPSLSQVTNRITKYIRSSPFRSYENARIALGLPAEEVIIALIAYSKATAEVDLKAKATLSRLAAAGLLDIIGEIGTAGMPVCPQLALVYQPEMLQLLPALLSDKVLFAVQFTQTKYAIEVMALGPSLWTTTIVTNPLHPIHHSFLGNVQY